MNTRIPILLFSVISGFSFACVELSIVAEVLGMIPGKATVLIGASSGLSVFFLVQLLRTSKLPFLSFSFVFFVVLALTNFGFHLIDHQSYNVIQSWFIWFILSMSAQSWVIDEFVNRFIPVTERYKFFSNTYLCSELAAIIPAMIVSFTQFELHFKEATLVACFSSLIIVIMILFFMIIPKVYEIRVSRYQLNEVISGRAMKSIRSLTFWIFIFGASAGVIRFLSNHMVNTMLRNDLHFFDQRQDYFGYGVLLTSFLTLIFSVFLQRKIRDRRISPFFVFYLFFAVIVVAGFLCFARFEIFLFLLFGSLLRGALKGLYNPALNSLLSGFSHSLRNKFQAIHSMAFLGMAGLMFGLAYFLENIFIGTRLIIHNVVFVILAILLITLSRRVRFEFIRNYYRMLRFGSQSARVYSALLLSYIRPRAYREQMLRLLQTQPESVILRKVIYEGLGLVWDDCLLPIFEGLLRTYPKPGRGDQHHVRVRSSNRGLEELQIVAIGVLARSADPQAHALLFQSFRNPDLTFSFRVRRQAAMWMKKIAGPQAMSYFIEGLKSDNERLVADSIEILGVFKHSSLISEFKQLLDSPFIRVRYNALKELYAFSKEKSEVCSQLQKGLESLDPVEARAALYVAGSLHDKKLPLKLPPLSLDSTQMSHTIYVVWAYRAVDPELFSESLVKLIPNLLKSTEMTSFLHLFSQLTQKERFRCLELLALQISSPDDEKMFQEFRFALRDSNFDFHEEADFMESVYKPVSFLFLGKV